MKHVRRRVVHPGKSPFSSPKAVVQQHMAEDVNINTIVAKARRGIPPTNIRQDQRFVDMSDAPQDLTEAFQRVESAMDLFEQLPAKAREELDNDPRKLLRATPEFMIRHGLMPAPQEDFSGQEGGQPSSGGTEPPQPPKGGSKAKPSQGSKTPSPDQPGQD